jgi:CRISPR-associated protein Csm1
VAGEHWNRDGGLKMQREYQILLLGALLHDIGKFYQRGLSKNSGKHTTLGQDCFENLFRERLSYLLNQGELNLVESAIGNHHNFEKHITLADCLSAGMERISLDNEETGDPTKERLLSIFNNISLST